MKKFLITGGVLFSILPAMALNLSPLYKTTAPDNTGDCSGSNFQSDSVSMQAIYVTDSCDAGYYLDVDNNAAIDSTTGIITGASCQPCTDGHYCSGVSDITLGANNSLTSQGETDCPTGTYGNSTDRGTIPNDTNDPDYNDIISKYTECQLCPVGTYASTTRAIECTPCANGSYASTEGNSTCTPAQAGYYALADHSGEAACTGATYASGTGNTSCTPVTPGWYANVNHSDEVACPAGYNAVAAESQGYCTKVVNCSNACSNLNNVITADDNPEDPTKICSASINYPGNSSITDDNGIKKVLYSNRNTDALCIVNRTCKPGYTEQNMYEWLAEHSKQVSGIYTYCSPNGTGAGCTSQDAGMLTMTVTGNSKPTNEIHFATACTTQSADWVNPNTLIAPANVGFTSQNSGSYCWARNIDAPGQPWFFLHSFNAIGNLTAEEACASYCGADIAGSDTYMFWNIQNGDYTQGMFASNLLPALANMTASDTNVDVCVANTITINWGDIADPGDAGTCTYGEDFTAPQSGPNPADHPGLKFLGWKVIPTNNNNNN